MITPSRACLWLLAAMAMVGCATGGTGTSGPSGGQAAVDKADSSPAGTTAKPPETTAEPPEEINAFTACAKRARRREILLDTASRRLLQTVCGAALWFDGLFGERNLNAALKSYGSIEVSTAYSEFEGSQTRVRFDARVQLPAMHQRLSLFVGIDNEDDFVRDRTEGNALRSRRRAGDRDAFLAGLGFVAASTDRFQSEFKVGARNVRAPQAFVQNRLSFLAYSDKRNQVVVRLTPFWNTDDRDGVTGSTDVDRAIEEAFLLRWGNVATLTRASFDWRSALILYQNLVGSRALAYEVFIRGATGALEPVGEYGSRVIYRWPVYEERLFFEGVLGYSWPRNDPTLERQGSADVGLGVEMPFGIARK